MSSLSVEQKLFFQLSKPSASADEISHQLEASSPGPDGIDFEMVFDLAVSNGTAGFLYKKTKELKLFPEKLEQELYAIYKDNVFHNLKAVADTLRLITHLQASGIESIPLKGAHASDMIFEDMGVYQFSDIDLLVSEENLQKVKRLLIEEQGFEQTSLSEEDLLASHYHLMYTKDNHMLVEVHWNLAKRYIEIPSSFWWEECSMQQWNNREITVLSVEKYLMYAVFRLFDHCFHPLRFFVLIAGIIEKYSDEIDWDKLLEFCTRYKMKKMMVFTLQLLQEWLGKDIPEVIRHEKIVGGNYLKGLVLSGLMSGIERPHLRMMAYTMLLDSPLAIFKILVGRLFPGKEELRLRYGLSANSWKVYLYYFLNPFLLLFRR
ncbi:nucleotidyltransferase family protein [Thermodesulfobacteriota bacterium]